MVDRIPNRKLGSRAYVLNYFAKGTKTMNPNILFFRMLLFKILPDCFEATSLET